MNRERAWLTIAAVLLVFTVLCATSTAYGSGFGIFTQGASALGQADAVVAHTDEPSAIFFNPALINNLPGTQMELGTTLIFPFREFKSDLTGSTSKMEDKVYYPSTFFISHSFNDKVSAGLGVFDPFGLGTEWDEDWEGRYIATKSKVETYTINPVVSYRLTPRVSFAAGVDFLWLDATLEKKLNLGLFGLPLPDAGQKFSGDGRGIGYNLGILVNISDNISLGGSYRSEIDVDIDGSASFNLPSPGLSGLFPNTGGETDITLPQQVFAGISYMASDQLTLEAGLRWEDWSSYKELRIDLDPPAADPPPDPKDWHATYAVNIGAKYTVNEVVSLLAGYLYGENPVPDSTFEPSIPDSDCHLFCVGTDMKFRKFKLAMSYAYQLQEERDKNNTVGVKEGLPANGRYDSELHLLGVSLVYRF